MESNNFSARILIAEDEEMFAKILEKEFRFNGFEVEIAVDGEDALYKILKHKPDFVLLDIMMPRRDGFSVFKTMQESDAREVPVGFLSALGEDVESFMGKDREMLKKASGFYQKDKLTPQQIVDEVKKTLYTKRD